jgi:hypothetical protein
MIIKRFFPNRWARITAWTGAAIAWVTSLLILQADDPAVAEVPPEVAPTEAPVMTTMLPAVPEATDDGLVVIRFTPTPPPPPQVITRTVTVSGGGSSGGGGATPAPQPADPVVSSGS